MKYGEIAANIRDRLGIAELNAMQLAVGASRSRKIMLIAPTGSGKTVAFAIALLRSLHSSDGRVQVSCWHPPASSSFRFVKSSAASRPVSEPLLSMAGTP